jgi:5-methylcytosine-specific restriction enzyme A
VKVCSEPGCPNLSSESKCAKHRRKPWSTGERPDRTRGHKWTKKRKRILRRDPVCRICNRAPSEEVDHIVPIAEGGTDDLLQGACKPCHRAKTQAESRRARGLG